MTVAVRRPGRRLPTPLYPIAIICLVVLHLWAASGVSPFAAFRGLLVAFLIGVAVAVLSTAAMRGDRHRGGLLAVLLILAVVAGGRAGIVPLLLVAMVLLLVERYGPWHPRLNWAWISRLVARGTAIFALAVLLEAIQLGRLGDLATVLQREGPLRPGSSASAPVAAADGPDVYVILLDGYARRDVLADSYGLDESPFLDGLTGRGFEIARASHSNYLVTNLSLSSMLNYRRVEDVPELAALASDPGAVNGPPVYRAASGSAVLADFREAGYETIAISSGFEQVALRTADRFIDPGQVNEFEIQLLRPSFLATIATGLVPDVLSGQHRDRTRATFEALGSLASESADRPRFVFAHVPSPHAPWVDNGDGSPRVTTNLETWYSDTPEATGLSRDAVIAGYGGQVTHVGRQALDAVDQILAASDRPPVILVISDHGSSLDVTTENAEVRLRNLFAAYTPGRSGLYPADTTLVNVFPTLFGAYLGIDRPRASEAIFSQGPGGLWDPVEIPR